MNLDSIIEMGGNSIYYFQGASALYGAFCIILLMRRISQKRFSSSAAAEQFIGQVRDELGKQNLDGVVEICDSPPYWAKAVPQLILVAMDNRTLSMSKLRKLLAEKFERDVLADIEYRLSWVSTIVKAAPMLGLLGTVAGMITAFGKIAAMQQSGGDPSQLAGDISFALWTTAVGLMIAIPLVAAGNLIHIRVGKLQDEVQQYLGYFLEDFDAVMSSGSKAT